MRTATNKAATMLGKRGGKARARLLTRAERVRLAKKAARARWGRR